MLTQDLNLPLLSAVKRVSVLIMAASGGASSDQYSSLSPVFPSYQVIWPLRQSRSLSPVRALKTVQHLLHHFSSWKNCVREVNRQSQHPPLGSTTRRMALATRNRLNTSLARHMIKAKEQPKKSNGVGRRVRTNRSRFTLDRRYRKHARGCCSLFSVQAYVWTVRAFTDCRSCAADPSQSSASPYSSSSWDPYRPT